MTKIRIFITKEILERSMMCGKTIETIGKQTKNCAIALAVRELFPRADVFEFAIDYFGEEYEKYINPQQLPAGMGLLPIEATEFIRLFDLCDSCPSKRLDLPEIDFEIEVPDSVIARIGIAEATQILERSETMELVTV